MNPPVVSVVLPTCDRAWGLEVALNSVRNQTFGAWEVIVCDDASTDETAQIVATAVDARIRYHRQAQRLGMVGNWETGLGLAQGELLVFLCDDDALDPGFLERRVAALGRHRDAVVAFSGYRIVNRERQVCGHWQPELVPDVSLQSGQLLKAALSRQWFLGAAMYRKAAVQDVWPAIRGDDLVLDYALNLKLALTAPALGVFVSESDFAMMQHPGQNSEKHKEAVFAQTDRLLLRLLEGAIPDSARPLLKRERALWNTAWGSHCLKAGDRGQARRNFGRALALWPRSAWIWRQAAKAWIGHGNARV